MLLVSTNVLASEGPTDQLRPTLSKLIELLTDPNLQGNENKPERREKIMEAIKGGFDFTEMSSRILGSTWKKITPEEQLYFTELMTKLLENVYIGKLESYSGQTVEYVQERVKGKRAQVTTMVEHAGLQIPVHYIMNLVEEKWLVYDINIEGLSLVRTYQEDFRSTLRKKKFDGLVKLIEEKNRSFESETTKS